MKLAKSVLYGATALIILGGTAIAQAVSSPSAMYEVDEDRDGRVDRLLILEQSDSLA